MSGLLAMAMRNDPPSHAAPPGRDGEGEEAAGLDPAPVAAANAAVNGAVDAAVNAAVNGAEDDAWIESAFTGLLVDGGPISPRAHDPRFSIFGATAHPSRRRGAALAVGGAGLTPGAARLAGIGEAIERSGAAPVAGDQRIEASHARFPLDEPAVEPERWVLFHPEQYAQPGFPFRPFTRETPCAWVAFRQWPEGTAVWVPADMAYLYPGGAPQARVSAGDDPAVAARARDSGNAGTLGRIGEVTSDAAERACRSAQAGLPHQIAPGVSTGLSCGRDGDPVLLRGVQEVIERDGVMGAWWERYGVEEWDRATVLTLLGQDLASRLDRPHLSVRFFRIDSPYSAHVCVTVIEGMEHEGFVRAVGSACRETRAAAWLKSILEAVQGIHYVRRLLFLRREAAGASSARGWAGTGVGAITLPADFASHAAFHSVHPSLWTHSVFHRPPAADHPAAEALPEGLATLARRLGARHPILHRLMTPKGLAAATRRWHVIRVVIPGLQPLHGHHALAHLGGPLWAPRGLAQWVDHLPHPFA